MGATTTEANQLSWNITQLVEANEREAIDFEVPIQRGYVWNKIHDSSLIHSILSGIPISEFYFNRIGDTFEGIEGKQRNRAMCNFVNGLYNLHAKTPPVKFKDGTKINIAGCSINTLPTDFKSKIQGYGLRIYWFQDLSIDDKILVFTRINSGVVVSPADIARIRVKSRKVFWELLEHEAIATAARDSMKKRFIDEDIVQDIWMMANNHHEYLSNTQRIPILENTDVTSAEKKELQHGLDYMLALYKEVINDKKLFGKLRHKTHISSLGYMGVLASRKNLPQDEFVEKAIRFFSGEGKKATNNETYNLASTQGLAKPENVTTRMNELEKALTA